MSGDVHMLLNEADFIAFSDNPVWYTCVVHLYVTPVWYTCMVHLYGTPVWYTCMVHLYGTPVWYTCMVHLYGTPVWYTCMVHLLYGTPGKLAENLCNGNECVCTRVDN